MTYVVKKQEANTPITINVIMKRDDKTYKEKHLIYGSIVLRGDTEESPSLEQLIGMAQAAFGMEPEEVMLKISLQV